VFQNEDEIIYWDSLIYKAIISWISIV